MQTETRQLKKTLVKANEWIELAKKRVTLPTDWLTVEYQKDADLLYITFSEAKTTKTKSQIDKGIVYDYDKNNNLVGIEIWNLYGIFATA